MVEEFEQQQAPTARTMGIVAPLLTPFDEDGEIDRSALAELIDLQLHAGVHGILALGTVGQGPVMRADQRRTAAEIIADRIGGRASLILHVGTADFQTTILLARHAEALHPAGLAVSAPYYYSDHTSFEVAAHFAGVAEAVEVPIYIYEAPRYTGVTVTPGTAARICKSIPGLAGIIAEEGSLDRVLQYLRAVPDTYAVVSGSIECLLPAVPYHLAGVSSVLASPFPDLCVRLWNLVEQGQFEEAFQHQRQLNEIVAVIERYAAIHGRGILGEVFRMRGVHVTKYPRWPTEEFEANMIVQLREEPDRLGAFTLSAGLFQEQLPTEPPPVQISPSDEEPAALGEEVDQSA